MTSEFATNVTRIADQVIADFEVWCDENDSLDVEMFLQSRQLTKEVADEVRAHWAREQELQRAFGKHEFVEDYLSKTKSPTTTNGPSATMGPSEAQSSNRRQIGNYKLLQKIGQGGMGTVWMAEQTEPVRRKVALKLIQIGIDNQQVITRFEAERQALAMMEHQNIAKVLGAGTTDDGQPYFVMELVNGKPITEYCDDNQLTVRERIELMIPVCKAIQHAHQKGIIHRDVKPSNILVATYDGVPVPKVIDFGLAKALSQRTKLTDKTLFTEFGKIVGTLEYMSPEQAELSSVDIDTTTDIYSLGIVLYELLTGSTPLNRETIKQQAVLETLKQIREHDPPAPSVRIGSSGVALAAIGQSRQIDGRKLKDLVKGDLDIVVMKAISRDRKLRYETAAGFAEDILRYLNGEPINARPPTKLYRLRKYIGRHRGIAAAIVSIATVLLVATIVSVWLAIQWKNSALKEAKIGGELKLEVQAKEDLADRKRESTTFLTNLMGQLLRPNINDFEVVETGLSEMNQRFAGDIETQLEILDVLVPVLIAGENPKLGVLAAEQMVDLVAQLNSPDKNRLIVAKNRLSAAYRHAGMAEEAFAIQLEIYSDTLELFGPEHPDTWTELNNLGVANYSNGRFKDAANAFQEVYELRKKKFGDQDPSTLGALSNLANARLRLGQAERAVETFRLIFDAQNQIVEGDENQLDTPRHNLGKALLTIGEYEEAKTYLEMALETRQGRIGKHNPNTLKTQTALGEVHLKLQDYRAAVSHFEAAYPTLKEQLGESAEAVGVVARQYAVALLYLSNEHLYAGQISEAWENYKAAFVLTKTRLPGFQAIETIWSLPSLFK